ncbi:MAG: hypothetical protein QGH66_05840 [Dehalococcoidia bacterium]|nr:hypothetical protein [Dehalococcoidia bacterium]MDP7240541.1 hypothetical protein [Dehalococcoidia bacterium]
MAIENIVLPDEEVLASAGQFYATDNRLLRYSKLLWWQEIDEVSYNHLVSLPLLSYRPSSLAYLGFLVILLAIGGLMIVSLVSSLIPGAEAGTALFKLLLVLGVILEIIWFFLPISFYQVRAVGLGDKDATRWRIGKVGSEQTQKLVAAIQEHRPRG